MMLWKNVDVWLDVDVMCENRKDLYILEPPLLVILRQDSVMLGCSRQHACSSTQCSPMHEREGLIREVEQ